MHWPPPAQGCSRSTLEVQAADIFISSSAGSVRCAVLFAEALQRYGSELHLADVHEAITSIPSARRIAAPQVARRDALYGAILGLTENGCLSGPAAQKLRGIRQAGGFAYEPSTFSMRPDLICNATGLSDVEVNAALDEGDVCFSRLASIGIPSLSDLLRYLGTRLDPYEASCLAFTAGSGGVHAEAIVGRNLLSALFESAIPGGSAAAETGVLQAVASASSTLAHSWGGLQESFTSGDLKPSEDRLNWASIHQFAVHDEHPTLPDGVLAGQVTFAKEYPDLYGSDLIAVIIPPSSSEIAPPRDDAPIATECVMPLPETRVYVLRVQVKLCSTDESRIYPGIHGKGNGSPSAASLCSALAAGQGVVEGAVLRSLSAAGLQQAKLQVLNCVATTRRVSAAARKVFSEQQVALFDRRHLASQWEPAIIEFASRAKLGMYFAENSF